MRPTSRWALSSRHSEHRAAVAARPDSRRHLRHSKSRREGGPKGPPDSTHRRLTIMKYRSRLPNDNVCRHTPQCNMGNMGLDYGIRCRDTMSVPHDTGPHMAYCRDCPWGGLMRDSYRAALRDSSVHSVTRRCHSTTVHDLRDTVRVEG